MTEAFNWLDTETKVLLGHVPPEKVAPPTVDGYGLVMLECGRQWRRVGAVLKMLSEGTKSLPVKCPLVICTGLSLSEALYGQFELMCTDSVSVFLEDRVLENADPLYLDDLYPVLLRSPEFEQVSVEVSSVPASERGDDFLEQFFGQRLPMPIFKRMARKKARILQHWGNKLDAEVIIR